MTTTETHLDELDAIQQETRFSLGLDNGKSPFRAEAHPHIGEGGATTAYYQNAQLVGLASRVRDDLNRTILVCVDLRSNNEVCREAASKKQP